MKRHLDCKDYERMTFESVGEVYVGVKEGSRELYMALCMHSWDACRRNGYTAATKTAVFRKHMLHETYKVESDEPSTRRPLTYMIRDEPKTYRISFTSKGGIEVVCFDLENIDAELEGHYDSVSDLPTWVQERIAVLSVCHSTPPTPTVEGVGRRISEKIFWVYK